MFKIALARNRNFQENTPVGFDGLAPLSPGALETFLGVLWFVAVIFLRYFERNRKKTGFQS